MNVEAIVREYIGKSPHLSLATSRDNQPWVCEVHFVYDDALNLYFISNPATRHAGEIADNPTVAGNIIAQHPLSEQPRGVYFEGGAEIIEASEDSIMHYYEALQRPEAMVRGWLDAGWHMYRINVYNWAVFGNFDGNGMKKQELTWGSNES